MTDVTDAFFCDFSESGGQSSRSASKTILIGIGYHHAEKSGKQLIPYCVNVVVLLLYIPKALSDDELSHYLNTVPGMVIINRVIKGYEHRCVSLDNQKRHLFSH